MATDCLFANGRIAALEWRLIDRAKWNQLYEASVAEAKNLLEEIGYGADVQDKSDVENLIDGEMTEARELINEISPDPDLTALFLLATDGHNLKTLLKGKIQGENVEDVLIGGSSIPVDELKRIVDTESYDSLPPELAAAIKNIQGTGDPRILSAAVDNGVYAHIIEVLNHKKNPLLLSYFKAKIDFANILTIIRANVLGWEIAKVRPLLLGGGDISESALLDAIGMSPENLVKQLATGEHSTLIKRVLEDYVQHRNVTRVEQELENAAFSIVHEEKNDAFGIGPLANYLLQKTAEAKALRVMFTAKRAGVNMPLAELGIL